MFLLLSGCTEISRGDLGIPKVGESLVASPPHWLEGAGWGGSRACHTMMLGTGACGPKEGRLGTAAEQEATSVWPQQQS